MIQEFLNYQRDRKGLSENSLTAYKKDLQAFVRYAQPKGLRWSTITKQNIDAYLVTLKEEGKQPATINRHLSSIRNLLTWAHHEGKINNNAAQYCQQMKKADKLPEQAPIEKIEEYLSEEPKTERSEIIHGLIALLKDTGIRIQEAINIRLSDINVEERSIRISGKGSKERKVYFKESTIAHLARIANRYRTYLLPQADQRTFRLWMIAELKPYGIKTHPHALRHSFATTMLNNGADITTVSYLLGHTHVTTTQRYARISNTTARAQYERYA